MVLITAVFLDKDDTFLGTERIEQIRTCCNWCGDEYELVAVVENGNVARFRKK